MIEQKNQITTEEKGYFCSKLCKCINRNNRSNKKKSTFLSWFIRNKKLLYYVIDKESHISMKVTEKKKKFMVSSFSFFFSFSSMFFFEKEVNLKVNQFSDYLNVYFLSCEYVGAWFVINSNKMLLELITSWCNISNKEKKRQVDH